MKSCTERTRLTLFALFLWALTSNSYAIEPTSRISVSYGDWAPFTGKDIARGGILTELVRQAFMKSGYTVIPQAMGWSEALEHTRKQTTDVSIGWLYSPERANDFAYSESIAYTKNVFFHHRELPVSWDRLSDLALLRIGVTKGYYYGDRFEQARSDKTIRVFVANTDADNMRKLVQGEIDLFPLDNFVGRHLLETLYPRDILEITYDENPLLMEPLHLIISQQHPKRTQIMNAFNRGMKALKRSGEHSRILTDLQTLLAVERLRLITEDYAPFNYLNEHNQVTGISIEIMNRIMARLGVDRKVGPESVYPWIRAYTEIQRTPNAAIFSITRTPERESLFKWVGPILRSDIVLIGKKSSHLSGIAPEALGDVKICVIPADVAEQTLRLRDIPNRKLIRVNTPYSCAEMLKRGRVDLWAYGRETVQWYLNKVGENLSEYEETYALTESSQYIAFNKAVPENVIGRFQEALEYLQLSGELKEIMHYYLSQLPEAGLH
ncbi:MAG: transporter substrate-binding domain-containing protein [Pseudomonadales bacterium]|nr:transporter substrate-binding domain-containing protein [Pseudomonadales bacterium]